jgi:nitrogen fixation/metabolism regulation signal transduction histidine kinase
MEKDKDRKKGVFAKKGSLLLYQVTCLLVILMIIAGFAIFFAYKASLDRLITKSTDNDIQTKVDSIISSNNYISDMVLLPQYMAKLNSIDYQDAFTHIMNKTPMPVQLEISGDLQQMVDQGLMGEDMIMAIATPTSFFPEPQVSLCSDESLVLNWQPPDYLMNAILEEKPYLWLENGVPELNKQDEYLITLQNYEQQMGMGTTGFTLKYCFVGFIPMHDDVVAIKSSYNSDKGRMIAVSALVIGCVIIAVVLLMLLVLSRLIRKRITEPVNELSVAANEVLEGNLDIKVDIHEGEELEGLKHAFNEMVESIRNMVIRSLE